MNRISYAILAVYIVLAASIGWVAFGREDYVASTDSELLGKLKDLELKEEEQVAYKAGLAQLTENNQKRQDLAFQSFNIVVGALLGYLSSMAAQLRRKPEDES